MVSRRNFLKNTAAFGAILLSPMAFFRSSDGARLAGLATKFKQLRIFFEAETLPAHVPYQGPSFMAGLGEFTRARHSGDVPPADPDALSKAVSDDFVAGRLVIYKGWVFAETEARLMAEMRLPTRPVS